MSNQNTEIRFPPVTMRLRLRSTLFALGYCLSTLVYALPSVLTFPLPFRYRYAFISQWARFNLWWLGVTCDLRYRVEGREHLPSQPAVVLCKHQSAWETLALQVVLPPQVWLLKRELLWIPFFGWGLAVLEPIAIDRRARSSALRQFLDQGEARLRDGRWVIVFPEGTRIAPGRTAKFHPGGAKLAERTGAPVVPIAHNAGMHWRRRGFIKFPGTVVLRIGPVISPRGLTATQINERAFAWVEVATRELEAMTEYRC